MTYAQRLALDINTPPGTQVTLTDCFVVSEAGDVNSNGFWFPDGTNEGKQSYRKPESYDGEIDYVRWRQVTDMGLGWVIAPFNSGYSYYSLEDVQFPWLVQNWILYPDGGGSLPFPILTNPVTQQLNAPSEADAGRFVQGGTQPGIYKDTHDPNGGKPKYLLLGGSNQLLYWDGSIWSILDGAGLVLYYNPSDTPLPPDTDWLNPDDSPADLILSVVTEGQIVAAVDFINSGDPTADGTLLNVGVNEIGVYNYGNAAGATCTLPSFYTWRIASASGLSAYTGGGIFPFPGSYDPEIGSPPPGPTATRNDVAPDANWEVFTPEPPVPTPTIPDFGLMNEWQCLFYWATKIGANPSGGENELQLLRMIAAKY